MPETKVQSLFVDTSALKAGGFKNADFQGLLERARRGEIRILVSHIAWEEWRTQQIEAICRKVRRVTTDFEDLKGRQVGHPGLEKLFTPALAIWEEKDIEASLSDALRDHQVLNRIEIIPLGDDHGRRAWSRYFSIKVAPPFNPNMEDREQRRKDIPDSWIYEAALDLIANDTALWALCADDNLFNALTSSGARVFRNPREVIDALEPKVAQGDIRASDAAVAGRGDIIKSDPLLAALASVQDKFREIDEKVLGFVAYLEVASKDQILGLLSQAGLRQEVARNSAERLAEGGAIRDTGTHYVVQDRAVALAAASRVEEEIIGLLGQGNGDG